MSLLFLAAEPVLQFCLNHFTSDVSLFFLQIAAKASKHSFCLESWWLQRSDWEQNFIDKTCLNNI